MLRTIINSSDKINRSHLSTFETIFRCKPYDSHLSVKTDEDIILLLIPEYNIMIFTPYLTLFCYEKLITKPNHYIKLGLIAFNMFTYRYVSIINRPIMTFYPFKFTDENIHNIHNIHNNYYNL